MSETYKKFTAQDYSVTPFNAHKQYIFNSSSADDNQIKWYNVSWTSESISLYSSASSYYGSDTINTVKYNQLDHLFYKNFKNDTLNRFGYNNYLVQKRELYNKAQVISIPAGLYGHEIKPGSFQLSSSNYEIIDDSHGNLIVSGTIIENYPSDIRKNIFKLGPVKAFKSYDLNTIPGYAVKLYDPQNKEEGITKRFWRRGEKNPNLTNNYTTPKEIQSETDDSYYFNPFKYKNVTFSKNTLGNKGTNHSSINFISENSSHIVAPHNSQYNFNEEDFSISFWVKPKPLGYHILPQSSSIGMKIGGGIVYHVDSNYAYIISTEPLSSFFPSSRTRWEWGPLNVNSGQGVGNVRTGLLSTPALGDGEQQTENIKILDLTSPVMLGGVIDSYNHNGYTDWYVPTVTELYTADTNLNIFNPNGISNPIFNNLDASLLEDSIRGGLISNLPPIINELLTSTESDTNINQYLAYVSGFNNGKPYDKNFLSILRPIPTTTLPVRRIAINGNGVLDNDNPRYIICKSGTQTIVPNNVNLGTETSKNTSLLGTLQSKDIISQPQFPYEIYMKGDILFFDRSDGDVISSVRSPKGVIGLSEIHHILCQKSSSKMEIYIDGDLQISSLDTTIKQTQNLANLYIGSKGHQTVPDGSGELGKIKFFNGELSNINIWNESFNSSSVINISESINASPYIGNVFYQNGFAVITRPNTQNLGIGETTPPFEIAESQLKERLRVFPNPVKAGDLPNWIVGMDMKPDGTRFYTTNGSSRLFSLDLSTPFNLNTAGTDVNVSGITTSFTIEEDKLPNVSSTYKKQFNSATDIELKYDGGSLFTIGNGYNNMSGSEPLNNSKRYEGGIVEIPLRTKWDISSGSLGSMDFENAKIGILDFYFYHSDVEGYSAQQTMTTAQLASQIHKIDALSPNYYIMGGQKPLSFTWKEDGTSFFTTHTSTLERRFSGTPGNWKREFVGSFTDPFQSAVYNRNLGTSFKIEEWPVDTPWDINTIIRSGNYLYTNTKSHLGQLGTDPTAAAVNTSKGPTHYGKAGKTLDLSTIISPEGYPINIRGIKFNTKGTKMWVTTDITSISEPIGTRWAAGGWDQPSILNASSPNWIPLTTLGNEREGSKIWEFNLTIPWNIETTQFIKTFKLNEYGGILDRGNPTNDIHFANTGNPSPTYLPNDNTTRLRGLIWNPDGSSYITANALARTFLNISTQPAPANYKIQFQGSHMIVENEYQCTIDEHEFNSTLNISARKIKSQDSYELANFTTSSFFKPYITTVGLYNEDNELLVVGKMGQPIRSSNETDTTIILRWDS